MKYVSIGIHPDNAIGHVLKLYDSQANKDKISLLLQNRPLDKLPSKGSIPSDFQGRTIDLNAGELLGIGLVAAYHNWQGEQSGETYQAVVGLGDSQKSSVENYLSDGGVYQDSLKQKMLYQQVMVQGYRPTRIVTTQDVTAEVNTKVKSRERYPANCGLIINIYSEKNTIDYFDVEQGCELGAYNSAFAIWYQLPDLSYAYVMPLNLGLSPQEFAINTMPIELRRFPRKDEWEFNTSL